MTAPTPVCPGCGGPRLHPHPAGSIIFQHRAGDCPLLRLEDSRRLADIRMAANRGWPFHRPVTPTERALLHAVGYSVAVDAECTVWLVTDSIPARSFPTAKPLPPPAGKDAAA
jgi:hypothetical protein